ncbi:hypothetical protein AB0E88_31715 [Streptomyces sp. NPDC028635]|uniref:hypothetical protein n=1 Tax=Streptomyces sp. NPDC028635 TaxID=3154800 RepID=UPI00340ECE33
MQEPDQERTRERGSAREPWRRRSARGRTVIAATAVAVLALGGTVAYAATSGDSPSPPGASASSSPSPGGPDGRHERGGPGFGFGTAVHGEATVKDPGTGKWVVRIWQRGTVETVSGERVTVKSEDGASWTWTVGSDATLRGGTPKKGDTVLLVGTRGADGTRTAIRALTGDFADRGPGHHGGGFRDHRWDDEPSPSASGGGATT